MVAALALLAACAVGVIAALPSIVRVVREITYPLHDAAIINRQARVEGISTPRSSPRSSMPRPSSIRALPARARSG